MPPRRAALAFVLVSLVLDMLAVGIIVPVLPMLVLGFEGGDSVRAAALVGTFGATFATMQFLFAPVLGLLSDRLGRRPVIIASNIAFGLDYLLMAWAPSVGWLFLGRVLAGICAATVSAPSAYIADVTPPEKRAAAFGWIGAAFGLGFVLCPAVGGVLGAIHPRLPFLTAAVLCLLNALYGAFVLPESLAVENRSRVDLRRANPLAGLRFLRAHGAVFGLVGVVFLSRVAHDALPSTFVIYAQHRFGWNVVMMGGALAVMGISAALVQAGLTRSFVNRLGERGSLLLGLAFGVVGFALTGLAATTPLFCAAIPLIALWGIANPATQGLLSRRVGPDEQGRLQGLIAAVQGVAGIIGPPLFTGAFGAAVGGPLTRLGLAGLPFVLAGVILALGAVLAARVTRPGEA